MNTNQFQRNTSFYEFQAELDEVDAAVIHDMAGGLCFVNVLQSPGIVVGCGIGKDASEAAERAHAIAEGLNTCGL